jgi:hypothetical protein
LSAWHQRKFSQILDQRRPFSTGEHGPGLDSL